MKNDKTIAVLNAGSSTLKCALVQGESLLWKGTLESTSAEDAHRFLHTLAAREPNISAVGHRIVHGGEKFVQPTVLTTSVLKEIAKLSSLAPLHNPLNLRGIEWAQKEWPDVPHVGVFDTAFHHTIPEKNFTYAVPLEWRQKGIRRYGFHGISHQGCFEKIIQLDPSLSKHHVITCHLGNGCSLAAIAKGKCIDTTMGFTPMEGLMMGTRSGSIDPGIIFHQLNHFSPKELEEVLNRKSGLHGIAGTHDMRTITQKMQSDAKSKLAFDLFCHSLAKEIGSMVASLGRVDAIAFTGGIGENSQDVRAQVCDHLAFLKIKLAKSITEGLISTPSSETKVFLIKAEEEVLIAKNTVSML